VRAPSIKQLVSACVLRACGFGILVHIRMVDIEGLVDWDAVLLAAELVWREIHRALTSVASQIRKISD
jgi:hypothetical protein